MLTEERYLKPIFSRYRNGTSFLDTVPPDIHYMVDSYWFQFEPIDQIYFNIISCVIFVLGMTSIIGNLTVIYIFLSTKALRTPSNLYVMNLALSDFMMMFTMFPPVIYNGFYGTWALGPLFCEIYAMFGSLFGCVSIWSNTLIAKDRYNVIVGGMSRKPVTICGALLNLTWVWAICLAWALFPFFGWNRYVPEGNMTACGTDYFAKDTWNKSYIWVYGFWCYITPLTIIVISYYHILKAVHIHEKSMKEQAKKMNVQSLRNTDAKSVEIKLAKIALVTISLWFMAWTPYSFINMSGLLGFMNLSPLATICGSIFAKANAVYNPIVYGLSHPKYKQALSEKMPCLTCGKPESGLTSTTHDDDNRTTDMESTVA